MTRPRAVVAVVSWNNRDLVAAALRSLEPDFEAGNADVWVVDNASTDGSPALVREKFPWVSLIESSENLGYGSAVNLVARRTESEWIVPANDDIRLAPGALGRMLQVGAELSDAGAIAPRLVLPDGTTQHSVHSFPSIRLGLLFNLGVYRLSARLGDRDLIQGRWDPERRREVPWALATWLLVRRRAFEEVGGFDQSQWMYAEDLDLGWRLGQAGWKIVYEPGATVFHEDRAASTRAFGDQVVARHMDASYDWMVRRRGVIFTRAYALLNVLGVLRQLATSRQPERRKSAHYWLRIHRRGLRTRAEPLRSH